MTLDAIDRAVNAGARLESACEELGLSARTIQRWRAQGGGGDMRVGGVSPANKLSDEERALVLATANSAEFRDVGPKQIVPVLADRAKYVASESTFYRILKGAGQMTHREPSKPAAARPRELTATAPCLVWSWDITYLRSPVLGQFFYLYLIVDVFSRKVVAAPVPIGDRRRLVLPPPRRVRVFSSSTSRRAPPLTPPAREWGGIAALWRSDFRCHSRSRRVSGGGRPSSGSGACDVELRSPAQSLEVGFERSEQRAA